MITRNSIIELLKNPESADELSQTANRIRHDNVGDGIYLRGLVEVSNICARNCLYCGMRIENKKIVNHYRMTADEIIDCAKLAKSLNFGTVVLQAGESAVNIDAKWMAEIIKQIKTETGQNVTLSLSERNEKDLELWKNAGADRYLLRFETSDLKLFQTIHPGAEKQKKHPRIEQLKLMKKIGYQIGSGVMVGLPGQSYEILANDLLFFNELQLDMIGLGPYIAHPDTPLAKFPDRTDGEQVPKTAEMACKVLALARIINPKANIPSTTALSSIDPVAGRKKGLSSGANVFMPNLTPKKYREAYQIYPDKICVKVPEADDMQKLLQTFHDLNRFQITG